MALRDSSWSNLILMRIWRPQYSMVPGLRPCDRPRSWQQLWRAQITLSWFSASTNPRASKESRGWKKLRTQHTNQNYSSINQIQAWGTLPCITISTSWATSRYLGSWNALFHSENWSTFQSTSSMRVSQSIRVSMARRYSPKLATICVIACIIRKTDMLRNQNLTPWNQMLLAARSSQQQMMQTTSRGWSSSSHKTWSQQSTTQATTATTTTNSINIDNRTTTHKTRTTSKTGTTTTAKATTINNMEMPNRTQSGQRKNECYNITLLIEGFIYNFGY